MLASGGSASGFRSVGRSMLGVVDEDEPVTVWQQQVKESGAVERRLGELRLCGWRSGENLGE